MTDTVFFKHKYITQPTLTPEDVIVKDLQDLKHSIKGTINRKQSKYFEAIVKTEELINTDPENKVRNRAKNLWYANDPTKVMNCCLDQRVTLGGWAVTKGNKRRVLHVPPPSQPGDLTASTSPPRVAKRINIRRQFVNTAGTFSTGGRRSSPTSITWQRLLQTCKFYGVRVHSDLQLSVILDNT